VFAVGRRKFGNFPRSASGFLIGIFAPLDWEIV
jgi:hypothetical protein